MFEIPWDWVCSLMIRFLRTWCFCPSKYSTPRDPPAFRAVCFLTLSELLSGKQVMVVVYVVFWICLQNRLHGIFGSFSNVMVHCFCQMSFLGNWHQLIPPVLWPMLLIRVMHCLSSTSAPCKSSKVNNPSSFPLFLPEFACCFEISFVVHAKENQ